MKVMRIDASPKGDISVSRQLTDEFMNMLRAEGVSIELDFLDLTREPPPHVTAEFARATYTLSSNRTAEMRKVLEQSDRLCQRIVAADALVLSMPMYNWSMPSTVKAFIDSIVRQGVTYSATKAGSLRGHLTHHKVLFLTTRGTNLRPGSPFADMDALTLALRAPFRFIGVKDPTFVDAQPMEFASPEQRNAGIERARIELAGVAQRWAHD